MFTLKTTATTMMSAYSGTHSSSSIDSSTETIDAGGTISFSTFWTYSTSNTFHNVGGIDLNFYPVNDSTSVETYREITWAGADSGSGSTRSVSLKLSQRDASSRSTSSASQRTINGSPGETTAAGSTATTFSESYHQVGNATLFSTFTTSTTRTRALYQTSTTTDTAGTPTTTYTRYTVDTSSSSTSQGTNTVSSTTGTASFSVLTAAITAGLQTTCTYTATASHAWLNESLRIYTETAGDLGGLVNDLSSSYTHLVLKTSVQSSSSAAVTRTTATDESSTVTVTTTTEIAPTITQYDFVASNSTYTVASAVYTGDSVASTRTTRITYYPTSTYIFQSLATTTAQQIYDSQKYTITTKLTQLDSADAVTLLTPDGASGFSTVAGSVTYSNDWASYHAFDQSMPDFGSDGDYTLSVTSTIAQSSSVAATTSVIVTMHWFSRVGGLRHPAEIAATDDRLDGLSAGGNELHAPRWSSLHRGADLVPMMMGNNSTGPNANYTYSWSPDNSSVQSLTDATGGTSTLTIAKGGTESAIGQSEEIFTHSWDEPQISSVFGGDMPASYKLFASSLLGTVTKMDSLNGSTVSVFSNGSAQSFDGDQQIAIRNGGQFNLTETAAAIVDYPRP